MQRYIILAPPIYGDLKTELVLLLYCYFNKQAFFWAFYAHLRYFLVPNERNDSLLITDQHKKLIDVWALQSRRKREEEEEEDFIYLLTRFSNHG